MKLTKQEREFIRSYVRMAISKDWYRVTEYEVSAMMDEMDSEHRDLVEYYLEKVYERESERGEE